MRVGHSSHLGTWRRRIWAPPLPLFPGTSTPGTFQYSRHFHFDNTLVFQLWTNQCLDTLQGFWRLDFRTWDLQGRLKDISSEQVLLLILFPLALSLRDGCTQEGWPAVTSTRSQAELYMTSLFSGLGWKHRLCHSTSLGSSSDTVFLLLFSFLSF